MRNPKVDTIHFWLTADGIAVTRPGRESFIEYLTEKTSLDRKIENRPVGTPLSIIVRDYQQDGFIETTALDFAAQQALEIFDPVKAEYPIQIRAARLLARAIEEPYSFPDPDDLPEKDQENMKNFVSEFLKGNILPFVKTPDGKKVEVVKEYEERPSKDEQIRELLSLGKTEEALELLEQLTTDAVLLQSRYNGAKRQYGMGLMDLSEWGRTQAQINYAVMGMLAHLRGEKVKVLTKVGLKNPKMRLSKTTKV